MTIPSGQLSVRLGVPDRGNLVRHLTELSIVRNQILNPAAIRRVTHYITGELQTAGFSVRVQPFYWWLSGWRRHHNLIATLEHDAAVEADGRVIIGAHYDSVPFSPGADDNASGVATLLEIARLCRASGLALRRPVDFVAFGAEEEGCVGSSRYANRLKRSQIDVAAMVSLECVGYTDSSPQSQLVPPGLPIQIPDRGTFVGVIGNRPAQALVSTMEAVAREVTPELQAIGFVVEDNGHQLPATRLSDHAPFWDCGYPALMVTDTAFLRNPHYHRPHDRPETLDLEFMGRITRAVAAFTLTVASGGARP